MDSAGVQRIQVHDMRHTAATLMLARGTPVHVVARILGHRDGTMTLQRYAHVVPNATRQAIDDLDRVGSPETEPRLEAHLFPKIDFSCCSGGDFSVLTLW